MQTDSWDAFAAEMNMLCEAFDRKRSQELLDTYWTALSKMSLRDFKLAAAHAREKAGTDGLERFPKPGRFWWLRDAALNAQRITSRQSSAAPERKFSAIHAHANRCLTLYLHRNATPSEASLQAMLSAKRQIVANFELIATDDKVTGGEIRDALFKSWDKAFKPMAESESELHLQSFQRTGFAANLSQRQDEDYEAA